MDNAAPSPQTTLGILLGASEWPYTNLSGSPAFTRSAHKVRRYFIYSDHFGVRPENWLDLFDYLSSPSEIDQRIGTFLQERILRMKQGGTPARDLLFYYIGHGLFAPGSDQAYHLAIRSTRENSLRSSAISMAALAETLKTNARHLRRFVILDCCFSAESYKYLQSAPDQAALQQTISAFGEESRGSGFPGKGTALLCSSGNKVASLLLPDESGTMFSEAFIRALALGNTHQREKTHLSLHDLTMVIEEVLEDLTAGNAPRPYVGAPDQSEGNIATKILFFPNPPAIAAQLNKAEEERIREAEEAAREAEAERVRLAEEAARKAQEEKRAREAEEEKERAHLAEVEQLKKAEEEQERLRRAEEEKRRRFPQPSSPEPRAQQYEPFPYGTPPRRAQQYEPSPYGTPPRRAQQYEPSPYGTPLRRAQQYEPSPYGTQLDEPGPLFIVIYYAIKYIFTWGASIGLIIEIVQTALGYPPVWWIWTITIGALLVGFGYSLWVNHRAKVL